MDHLFKRGVDHLVRPIGASLLSLFWLFSPLLLALQKLPSSSMHMTPGDLHPTVVIGFVGGFVRSDNNAHSPVQLAARLRGTYPSEVDVKVFENRQGDRAHREIIKLLDTNHDGTLSDEERSSARIILYGMSWGGSAALQLSRELDSEKIPVLLTIQVDSISKWRQDDEVIPPNVAEAVNFYQPSGLLHGENQIRAADPSRTRILGNFRYTYDSMPEACRNYPWWDRLLVKQHTSIECDPAVWNQVENLIRSKLAAVGVHPSSKS